MCSLDPAQSGGNAEDEQVQRGFHRPPGPDLLRIVSVRALALMAVESGLGLPEDVLGKDDDVSRDGPRRAPPHEQVRLFRARRVQVLPRGRVGGQQVELLGRAQRA